MTRNNLAEHLSWLLKSANKHGAETASLRTLANVRAQEPNVSSAPSSNSCEPSVSSFNDSAGSKDTSFETDEEFVRPNLPASALRAQSRDDMARLQCGPKSNHKPRLLSESSLTPLHTQGPSVVYGPSNSLAAQYSRGFHGK